MSSSHASFDPLTVGWGPVLGARRPSVLQMCALGHCSTQSLNSELQHTIAQSHLTRSQGDDSSKFRVGRGWEGGEYKHLIFARFVFSL